jgi:hypothetical protein
MNTNNVETMVEPNLQIEQLWNTLQESRCPVDMPTGYMLLLSALDNGWQIDGIELEPSWDQNGFIYLVTLRRQSHKYSQRIILTRTPFVEYLLVNAVGDPF